MTLPRRRPGRVTSLLPALLVFLPLAASAQQRPVPKPPPPPDPLVRMNEAVDALTKKVWPSVVQILVSSYGARTEGAPGNTGVVIGAERSTGSGFVVDAEGYIVTNAHVVSGARRVQVVLPADNADGTLA
jgi:serine protease Do